MVVADLIDGDRRGWREEIVRECFCPTDVNAILNMPLGNRGREDRLCWLFEEKGMFSVKSAYNFGLRHGEFRWDGAGSVWSSLWKLNIPAKVKYFLWRAANDVLPSKKRLGDKSVPCSLTCVLYGEEVETTAHCLISCRFAKEVWEMAGFFGLSSWEDSFLPWLVFWMPKFSPQVFQLIGMVCWAIWHNRNAVIWRGSSSNSAGVLRMAKSLPSDWLKAQEPAHAQPTDQMMVLNQATDTVRATDPIGPQPQHSTGEGEWRVNSDAACFPDQACSGFGAVVRNQQGGVLGVFTRKLSQCLDPKLAEIWCIREVLSWLMELGVDGLVLESDSLLAVNSINNVREGNSYFSLLAAECADLLCYFQNVSIRFVARSDNQLAHNLARAAVNIPDYKVWGKPFDCLLSSTLIQFVSAQHE